MEIVVVGAGAMGCLFGALLGEAGQDVRLLDIRRDHMDAIKQRGLDIEWEGQVRNVKIHAGTHPDPGYRADLVIVFVKSTQTAEVSGLVRDLAGDEGLVLTLQNGMGNAEILAEKIDTDRIIAGTTSHGATLLGLGKSVTPGPVLRSLVRGAGNPRYSYLRWDKS